MPGPRDIHDTPGSRALATIVGDMAERLDNIQEGQAHTRAKVDTIGESVARIEAGMDGLIPRVYSLEQSRAELQAVAGDAEVIRARVGQVERLIDAHKTERDTRKKMRGILWLMGGTAGTLLVERLWAWVAGRRDP